MHSSRIRTARLSTISHSIPGPMYLGKSWGGGVVPTPWTYPPSRRDLVSEIPPGKDIGPEIPTHSLLWTNTCENNTFPQLRLRSVTMTDTGTVSELVRLNSLQHCNITIGLLSSNLLSNDISLFPTSNSKLQFIYSCF